MIKIIAAISILTYICSYNKPLRVSSSEFQTFSNYCNERYNYCIDYPLNILYPQPISTNGDGRKFESKDGKILLSVYGSQNWNVSTRSEESISDKFDDDLHNNAPGLHRVITYQKLNSNDYVISGYEQATTYGRSKQMIFFQKTIRKNHAFCTAVAEYEESQKKVLSQILDRVFKSFK